MMYILTENFFKNGNLPINLPKIVSEIKNLNQYLMSLGSKRTSVGMFNKLVTRGIGGIRGVKSVRRVSNSRRSVMQPAVAVAKGGYKTRKCTKSAKRRK